MRQRLKFSTFYHLLNVFIWNSFFISHDFPELFLTNLSSVSRVQGPANILEMKLEITNLSFKLENKYLGKQYFDFQSYLNTSSKTCSSGSCLLCLDTRVRYSLNDKENPCWSHDTSPTRHMACKTQKFN